MTADAPQVDVSWAKPGVLVRCVDARVRKVAPGAMISDFEKRHADLHLLDVMEILTIREVLRHRPFNNAWALRFVELERGIEGIRRHHAKKVYAMDRPFFLDRFVEIRDPADWKDAEIVHGPELETA